MSKKGISIVPSRVSTAESSSVLYSLENKSQIGKVDEIMGPINEVYFTVKMDAGMIATSFKADDKVYIAGDKLLPIERFLPKPKQLTKGESIAPPELWLKLFTIDLFRSKGEERWWSWTRSTQGR